MSERPRVAILGATGHVGKVLADGLAGTHALTLYARRPEVAAAFARGAGLEVAVDSLDALSQQNHDALINCIGVGDPRAVVADPDEVYRVTAFADDLALRYVEQRSHCRLINISSGAAYCSQFDEPADEDTVADLSAGRLRSDQHYGLAKLASEGRHRANTDLAIIDLRLFSLFSRHIDPDAGYLMNGVVRSLRDGTPFLTGPADHMRDYVAPGDLAALVSACVACEPRNASFDVFSGAPVGKFELLDGLAREIGLHYEVDDSLTENAATGAKPAYYSNNHAATELGYRPSSTSLETVIEVTASLLGNQRREP